MIHCQHNAWIQTKRPPRSYCVTSPLPGGFSELSRADWCWIILAPSPLPGWRRRLVLRHSSFLAETTASLDFHPLVRDAKRMLRRGAVLITAIAVSSSAPIISVPHIDARWFKSERRLAPQFSTCHGGGWGHLRPLQCLGCANFFVPCSCSAPPARGGDWSILSSSRGADYLSIRNIADFYDLGQCERVSNTLTLGSPGPQPAGYNRIQRAVYQRVKVYPQLPHRGGKRGASSSRGWI